MRNMLTYLCLTVIICFSHLPVSAQVTFGSEPLPANLAHEARSFSRGDFLTIDQSYRLDLLNDEGVIEFWFKRNSNKSLARKNEYYAVLSNGRSIFSEASQEKIFFARYAIYINEEVIAVQFGEKLQTISIGGSSAQSVRTDDGFIHVALIIENETVLPIINGTVRPRLNDMPLGRMFGSEVSVGSIGDGKGLFPVDGSRLKLIEEEVHDYTGELARIRIWSSAFSDRYFTDSAILTSLSDRALLRGIAIESLGPEYRKPALSELVARSNFSGEHTSHRMTLVPRMAGNWISTHFSKPLEMPDEQVLPPLGQRMGDMAIPPIVSVITTKTRKDTLYLYLDGRFMGRIKLDATGERGRFVSESYEMGSADVLFKKDGDYVGGYLVNARDVISLTFDDETEKAQLKVFFQPNNKAVSNSITLTRPLLPETRGEAVSSANEWFAIPNIANYLNTTSMSYDITEMNIENLTSGNTGTNGVAIFSTDSDEWLWDKKSSQLAVPNWLYVVPIKSGRSGSTSTTVKDSQSLQKITKARIGATLGSSGGGRASASIDAAFSYKEFVAKGSTQAMTIGMSQGVSHILAIDHTHVPLSAEFIRDIQSLTTRYKASRIDEQIDEDGNIVVRGDINLKGFIDDWGTHYPASVTFGQLLMSYTSHTQEDLAKSSETGLSLSVLAQSQFGAARAGLERETTNARTSLSSENRTIVQWFGEGNLTTDPRATSVNPSNSVPIFMDLRPLHELLSPVHFDDPYIYHDVRELLRLGILNFLDAGTDVAQPSVEHWSKQKVSRPSNAKLFLKPVGIRAVRIDERTLSEIDLSYAARQVAIAVNNTEGDNKSIADKENSTPPAVAGEFFGGLSVTPILKRDKENSPTILKGPEDEDCSSNNNDCKKIWWEASEASPAKYKNNRLYKASDDNNFKVKEEQAYHILQNYNVPWTLEDNQRSGDSGSLVDVDFKFEWWALEDDDDVVGTEDDQLWGCGTFGGDNTLKNDYYRDSEGNPINDDEDSLGRGRAIWTVPAYSLRYGTREKPIRMRLAMQESPLMALVKCDNYQSLYFEFDAWLEGGTRVDANFDAEDGFADYTRFVYSKRPKPTSRIPKDPIPESRMPFTHPNLVGFFPFDENGTDLSGLAGDLETPVPQSRLFDGGLLFADPYLGREGTFNELPHFDPIIKVPEITDGSFTIRMSFRARSPQSTGVSGDELRNLPLLVRGDNEFVITNEAISSGPSLSYSEMLNSVNRDNPLSGESTHRSPVWATVTVAVDLEHKRMRYRFDTTLPHFMNFLPKQKRSTTRLMRLSRGFKSGSSTDWFLSANGENGEMLYAADAVDELMFFNRALSFEEMADLPVRESPGTIALAKASSRHVASMYKHAARLLELDGVELAQSDIQPFIDNLLENARKNRKPKDGWSVGGKLFLPHKNAKGEMYHFWENFADLEQKTQTMYLNAIGFEHLTNDHCKSKSKRNKFGGQTTTINPVCMKDINTKRSKSTSRVLQALGPTRPYFSVYRDMGVADNGNNKLDAEDLLQLPREIYVTLSKFMPSLFGNKYHNDIKPFNLLSDMILNYDIEWAVRTADFDNDLRLNKVEAKALTDALSNHYALLGSTIDMPPLPNFEGVPITVYWKPANDNAQKLVADWLTEQLKTMGLSNDYGFGIQRL